ncbi:ATP-binding protein [Marinifilum sp. JC120]|nr:ATP-binding protein [Marinifilum sp. JC120]
MNNPFRFNTLRPSDPFCDREKELADLILHGMNGANVTLFSPRRYGKTSLIKRAQKDLHDKGAYVFYVDFYRVMSVEDLASRLAKAIYEGLSDYVSFFEKSKKALLDFFKTYRPVFTPTEDGGIQIDVRASEGISGYDLLESLLSEIGRFAEKVDKPVHIAMDEFQDIVEVDKGKTEALLRTHIQMHSVGYIFAGSRRRILKSMFTDRHRPFYNSTLLMELPPLPHDDLVEYIVDLFEKGGNFISHEAAASVSNLVQQYPYYAQLFCYLLFSMGTDPNLEDVDECFESLLASERYSYQGVVDGLTSVQQGLLVGLAKHPGSKVTSQAFLRETNLSPGGVQKALKHLSLQDLISDEENGWNLVDPVFRKWLVRTF